MIILGIDPATKAGWARYDTEKPLSAIVSGTWRAEGDFNEAKSASIGRSLMRNVKQFGRPDMVIIETPMRTAPAARRSAPKGLLEGQDEPVVGVQGLQALIVTNQVVGALSGVIGAYGLPFEMVAPRSWRKSFFGSVSAKGMDRAAWKRMARERCDQLKIDVSNMDEAEAVGIAFHGAGTQTYKLLRSRNG